MRMSGWIVTLAIWLVALPAFAAELGTRHTLAVDKQEREYHLYAPAKDRNAPQHLVVVLHDMDSSPREIADISGFSGMAEQAGFIVAYPRGSGHRPSWNAGDCCGYAERTDTNDVRFIEAMVQDIRSRHEVDPLRVYVAGLGAGGMMAYRLGCELSGVFSAIGVVGGSMQTRHCDPKGRPAVIAFHALDDREVPYDGGRVRNQRITPVRDAMLYWKNANLCRDFPAHGDEKAYTTVTYFCAEDRHVALHSLRQGGHHWPKDSLDATAVMWEFFRNHPPRRLF